MGRVEALEVAGLVLWFNSNDHLPPHLHAERPGKWGVAIRFLRPRDEMIEVIWGRGPSGRERRELLDRVEARRFELHAEWARKVSLTSPGAKK